MLRADDAEHRVDGGGFVKGAECGELKEPSAKTSAVQPNSGDPCDSRRATADYHQVVCFEFVSTYFCFRAEKVGCDPARHSDRIMAAQNHGK
jgi:hypothetical protein